MNNKEELEKKTGIKKFDICLMNPPYDSGLGNRFLDKVIDIANKVITVQPATWLFTLKQDKSLTEKTDKIYCEIETFNGMEYFDAGISGLMGIQYFDNKRKHEIIINGDKYEQCKDIKIYAHDKNLLKIASYLKQFSDFVWQHRKDSEKDKINENAWCIKIPQIRGHINKSAGKYEPDFFTVISKDTIFLQNKKQHGQWKNIIGQANRNNNTKCICLTFKTEDELNNFEKYLKSDFVRMFLLISKTNMNQWSNRCLDSVPWFDFSQDIFSKSPREIDDYLFKKYNISNEIRKHIEEILPDYYNIRK